MKHLNVTQQLKLVLDPKKGGIKARLFVTREDGITVYDTVQDQSSAAVAALVSGAWQASEALMGLVQKNQNVMEFRFGFDTSSQGIFLFPFELKSTRYFLGAIYHDCINPGQLKRQISLIREEMDHLFKNDKQETKAAKKSPVREGFLFQDISDEEIDRLFSPGGI